MQMRPFFDRSLPAIMLRRPLLVLSILESYELYIRVKLSRQVFFSYNNNNNNNCIRNRKEQWRIGRFNLEFTKVRENPFRFVFYSGQRNRRFPIQRYNNAPCPSQLRIVPHSNDTDQLSIIVSARFQLPLTSPCFTASEHNNNAAFHCDKIEFRSIIHRFS